MSGRFLRLITIDEARRIIDANIQAIGGFEIVPLIEADGRILFEDLHAPVDLPPFNRALMDGYAVRSPDTFGATEEKGIRLKVIGEIRAGDAIEDLEVGRGEAVEVATGARIPEGADSVLMVEFADRVGEDELIVYRHVAPGENIQMRGDDIRRGENLLRRGTGIHAREIGILAALGMDQIKVLRRPRVCVISTGNELEYPGRELREGKIFDANGYMITAALLELGADASFIGVIRDSYDELRGTLESAISGGFDIVIISGGTSAGRGDILYRVVEDLGELLIHGVRIKPGKPFLFGLCRDVPIFGLPGYPVSAMITFETFVEPVLQRLTGTGPGEKKRVKATVGARIHSAKGRHELMPVRLEDSSEGVIAYQVHGGSGAIRTLLDLDGYIRIGEEVEIVEEGEGVEVELRVGRMHLPPVPP